MFIAVFIIVQGFVLYHFIKPAEPGQQPGIQKPDKLVNMEPAALNYEARSNV